MANTDMRVVDLNPDDMGVIVRKGGRKEEPSRRGLYIGGLVIAFIAIGLALSSGQGKGTDNASQNPNPERAPAGLLMPTPENTPDVNLKQENPAGFICEPVQKGEGVLSALQRGLKAQGVDLSSDTMPIESQVFVFHRADGSYRPFSTNDILSGKVKDEDLTVQPRDLVCKVRDQSEVKALFSWPPIQNLLSPQK